MSASMTRQLRQYERQLDEAERHAQALRQVVEGLRILSGTPGPASAVASADTNGNGIGATNGHVPKGMDAVRAIAASRPNALWSRKQILREFQKRGWITSGDPERFAATVDAAIHRLRKSGEATRVKPGYYRFADPQGRLAA